MRLIGAIATALMVATVEAVVVAQGTSTTARFDVVSVRPVEDASVRLSQVAETLLHVTTAGQLVGRSNLEGIVRFAYGVQPYEGVVPVEPDSAARLAELFEVRALPAEAFPPPDRGEVLAMTRQMLAERFGVNVRIETELARVTVLRTIEPGILGPGVRPAPDGCTQLPTGANRYEDRFADAFRRSCVLTSWDDRLRGTVTLDEFARTVSFLAGRPILNRTDLEGMFTIDVAVASASYVQDVAARFGGPNQPVAAAPSDAPAFVEALRDQMGLAVRTERQPIRRFVVEHIGPFVEN